MVIEVDEIHSPFFYFVEEDEGSPNMNAPIISERVAHRLSKLRIYLKFQ